MNYDASLCLVVLLALHSEWRVLRFELVCYRWLLRSYFVLSQCYHLSVLMCQSACSCRVAKRLGLLLWWAIVLETMPYRTVQRVRCPLFYIPSPSDVGIVFLLSLTALVLRLQDLLRCRRAFRSRDCVVIIYGSITANLIVFALRPELVIFASSWHGRSVLFYKLSITA